MGTAVGHMEVVVRGRNVEVPDHFRVHVTEKLSRIERYDQKIIRADVELHHERNRRQNDRCQHVEITCRTRGPVVRSEACAADFYSALDQATERLERRFRQAADRRRVHHGRRTPTSLASATASAAAPAGTDAGATALGSAAPDTAVRSGLDAASNEASAAPVVPGAPAWSARLDGAEPAAADGNDSAEDGPGRVVRHKEHPGKPITVDQALLEMELVGHDFYLFADADSGRPSVVYRRHAYDYGLIRLSS
jgi:ribosomal subunit interface protein